MPKAQPILLSLALLASAAHATEPEFAKLNTSDAGVIDPGAVEVCVAYDFCEARKSFADDRHTVDRQRLTEHVMSVGLTAGVSAGLDVAAGLGYTRARDREANPAEASGITDLALSGRWRLAGTDAWAVALLPALLLPIGTEASDGNAGTTQGYTSAGISLLYQRALGPLPANLEAGYTIGMGSGAEEYEGTATVNLAIGWQAAPGVLPIVEANWSRDSFAGASSSAMALTVGVLFPTENAGRFQLGASPVVAGRNTDAGIACQFSWVREFSPRGVR